MGITFSVLQEPYKILAYWDLFMKSRFIKRHDVGLLEKAFGRVLTRNAFAVIGEDRDEIIAIVIMSVNQTTRHIEQVYCKAHCLKDAIEPFWAFCKENGIRKVTAFTYAMPEAFERLFGMNRLYTVFGKEL
jgi:hypothetical protein